MSNDLAGDDERPYGGGAGCGVVVVVDTSGARRFSLPAQKARSRYELNVTFSGVLISLLRGLRA